MIRPCDISCVIPKVEMGSAQGESSQDVAANGLVLYVRVTSRFRDLCSQTFDMRFSCDTTITVKPMKFQGVGKSLQSWGRMTALKGWTERLQVQGTFSRQALGPAAGVEMDSELRSSEVGAYAAVPRL